VDKVDYISHPGKKVCRDNEFYGGGPKWIVTPKCIFDFDPDTLEARLAQLFPGVTVDGNDFLAVYEVVSAAAERARAGQGPTLVESLTYRWRGHSRSDRQVYRTRQEVKEWQARDPINRFADRLQKAGLLSAELQESIRASATQGIEDALAFAEASPEPDLATILEGVYAD